mgnify:CR=1 FL=1
MIVGPYRVVEEVGKGSFAQVYLARHESTPRELVAIKSVIRSKLSDKLFDNLEVEIAILKSVRHPAIVELKDCIYSDEHVHLIMQYCIGGDLSQYIKQHGNVAPWDGDASSNPFAAAQRAIYPHPPDGGLNDAMVRSFLAQLASAVQFLRSNDIVHRDLKPQNLLLQLPDSECRARGHPAEMPQIKVTDFGFARSLPAASLAKTLCGSPLYMAPEILRYENYDAKADLWSVGAVLYEMSVGKPPFRAANHVELLRRIELSNDRIKFPDERSEQSLAKDAARRRLNGEPPRPRPHPVADDIKALIRKLLKRHPVERASFSELFHDPVILGVPYLRDTFLNGGSGSPVDHSGPAALDDESQPLSVPDPHAMDPEGMELHDDQSPAESPAFPVSFPPSFPAVTTSASRVKEQADLVTPMQQLPLSDAKSRTKAPPSALSRVITMASGRMFRGWDGSAPRSHDSPDKLLSPYPDSPDGNLIRSIGQKAYVLCELADARVAEAEMEQDTSAPAEALAIYARAIGFLQRGVALTEHGHALESSIQQRTSFMLTSRTMVPHEPF